jgi:sulfate adenylyltransferase subunit 1 (EFTu-like GTPase family)
VQLANEDEVSGTLKSGEFSVGDKLRVNASDKTVTIKSIMAWPLELAKAEDGMALRLKLNRKLKRGDLLTDLQSKLSHGSNWEVEWSYLLERPFETSESLVLKHETREFAVEKNSSPN